MKGTTPLKRNTSTERIASMRGTASMEGVSLLRLTEGCSTEPHQASS